MKPSDHVPVPRWPGVAGTLVALAGIGVSAYLTYAHYTSPAVLACSDHGVINCTKVTTSSYSVIAGVPLAVLGLAYFVAMAILELPHVWRSRRRGLRGVRVLASAAGVLVALWLVYLELFRLDAICLYCTAVHCLAFVLFVITAVGTAWSPELMADCGPSDEAGPSGSYAAAPSRFKEQMSQSRAKV